MPILYVLGDSFTTSYQESKALHSKQAFPFLLAEKLGYECHNFGKVGNYNTRILDKSRELELKEDDILLVCWSTPYRQAEESTAIVDFIDQIKEVENRFGNRKLIQTQAFSPLIPYEIDPDKLLSKLTSKSFLHWGKPNNTLIDLVTDCWLDESKTNIQRQFGIRPKDWLKLKFRKEFKFLSECYHFNELGHSKVASFLEQEMRGRFSLPRRSRHARIL